MKYMNEVWVGGKYNSNGGFVDVGGGLKRRLMLEFDTRGRYGRGVGGR